MVSTHMAGTVGRLDISWQNVTKQLISSIYKTNTEDSKTSSYRTDSSHSTSTSPGSCACLCLVPVTVSTSAAGVGAWGLVVVVEESGDTRGPRNILMLDLA